MDQISGIIKSVLYTNMSNGYSVCDIKTEEGIHTLTGYMPLLVPGETIEALGRWNVHPEYGRQFKVESCERHVPSREEEMEKYLASGFIKGLGPSTAKRIVETFKEDTFRILQFEPYRLAEIKGIAADKALAFGQAFSEHENMRGTVMLIQRFGVSSDYATKVWRRFGLQSEEEIRRNPYCLAETDIGLTFKACDRIAFGLGIEPGARYRLRSALMHLLVASTQNGHTYLPKQALVEQAARLTQVSEKLVEDALDSLILDESVGMDSFWPGRIYLPGLLEGERYVSLRLLGLNRKKDSTEASRWETFIDDYEKTYSILLDELQKKAVNCALENGLSVVTGGPGTGKTTIIKCLLNLFESQGLKVVLAAPTGRAAKRISETSGCEAKTLHRLLEVGYSIEKDEPLYFSRNEDNPLEADVIIVDEASMMDLPIAQALLKALPFGSRLILVGDADQLPSVGPGKVLSDILECGVFPVVRLNTIFRQAGESLIVTNAHRINRGEAPELNREDGDFYFLPRLRAEEVSKTVVELVARIIPDRFGFDSAKQIQVLTPMRKGENGVYNLNRLLQARLNPPSEDKAERLYGSAAFRVGDRIMQIKNDYTRIWTLSGSDGSWSEGQGVYNGDTGSVLDVDLKAELLTVRFDDGRTCEYRFDALENLEHAYAVTVHKSQGSEFPAVVLPLYGVPSGLVCRNLIYTAVTRAKKLVILVGSVEVLERMVQNENERERYSGLKERLCEG